jgi:formylglycine-generating enzyme required for sulfatase activity
LTAWNEKKVGSNDPAGTASRVLRGGSWDDLADFTRAATRFDGNPNFRNYFIGFRVVCLPH